MDQKISGTLLLDPAVLLDPYPLYRQLRERAPVWDVSGTGVYIVSTFELLVEASSRVEDFSSAMKCLIYRDDAGLPGRFTFGDTGGQVLTSSTAPASRAPASRAPAGLKAADVRAVTPGSSLLPTNYGLESSLDSYLNAQGVDVGGLEPVVRAASRNR